MEHPIIAKEIANGASFRSEAAKEQYVKIAKRETRRAALLLGITVLAYCLLAFFFGVMTGVQQAHKMELARTIAAHVVLP